MKLFIISAMILGKIRYWSKYSGGSFRDDWSKALIMNEDNLYYFTKTIEEKHDYELKVIEVEIRPLIQHKDKDIVKNLAHAEKKAIEIMQNTLPHENILHNAEAIKFSILEVVSILGYENAYEKEMDRIIAKDEKCIEPKECPYT